MYQSMRGNMQHRVTPRQLGIGNTSGSNASIGDAVGEMGPIDDVTLGGDGNAVVVSAGYVHT